MKKLGILTFWGVPNVGTYAQAYALQKYISKLLPKWEICQIAYLNDKHKDFYHLRDESTDLKQNRINRLFEREYNKIPHTELCGSKFDVVVLGSDIIWDFSISVFGEDQYLFGNGFDAAKVVSYAPSFGTCKREWRRIPDYVRTGLAGLSAVSVRDINSAVITENIIGLRPKVVLDPAWLWDWETDDQIIEPDITDYIMVYGQDFSESFRTNLILYAEENRLKLVAYPNGSADYHWCDIILNPVSTIPLELLGYFKKAELVATSTFHGITFGLIFEKKIAYAKTQFIEYKIHDFLVELGIHDYFNDDDVSRMFNGNWDYDSIKRIINEKRTASEKFLVDAIGK